MVKVTVGQRRTHGRDELVTLSRKCAGAVLKGSVLCWPGSQGTSFAGPLEAMFASEVLQRLTGNQNARHPAAW